MYVFWGVFVLIVIIYEYSQCYHSLYFKSESSFFHLFQHMGGHGPYVQFPTVLANTDIPSQCHISQVHFLGRHGERYPTLNRGIMYERTLSKFKNSNSTGPLDFLNTYKYFVSDTRQYGQLTTKGIYNGAEGSISRGRVFKETYAQLFKGINGPFPVFAASSHRVLETARLFAQGMDVKGTKVISISESKENGANSLTPDHSCKSYNSSTNEYSKFFAHNFHEAFHRLSQYSGTVDLTLRDVKNLVELCAFEKTAIGMANFCDIFNENEHIFNGYSRALRYYYKNGPGNNLSATLGSVYLNATVTLLEQEAPDLPVYISFTHDTHINFLLSALGVFTGGKLHSIHMDTDHPWVQGDLTPMGANVIFEKIKCNDIDTSYIRIVVNDAVIPFQDCTYGPGKSCPLEEFVNSLSDQHFEYVNDCALQAGLPQHLSFFWDWKNTNNYI